MYPASFMKYISDLIQKFTGCLHLETDILFVHVDPTKFETYHVITKCTRCSCVSSFHKMHYLSIAVNNWLIKYGHGYGYTLYKENYTE